MNTETPWKIGRNLNFEETIFETPKPQATSTAVKKNDTWREAPVLLEPPENTKLSGVGFLKDGMEALAEMKDRLAMAGLNVDSVGDPVRVSLTSNATSSSLGLLREQDFLDTTDLLSNLKISDVNHDEEEKHKAARQRALQALNLTNTSIVQDPVKKQSRVSLPPKIDTTNKENVIDLISEGQKTAGKNNTFTKTNSFPEQTDLTCKTDFPEGHQRDTAESGFSVILSQSQLDKDEEECNKEWPDLPLEPRDVSLSGRFTSDPSINFMPEDDSFLQSLGPSDPPKPGKRLREFEDETVTVNDSYEEGLRSYFGDSRLARLDSEVSVPSISEIAETLHKLPSDATPLTIMEYLLNQKKNDSTILINSSSSSSGDDIKEVSNFNSKSAVAMEPSIFTIANSTAPNEIDLQSISLADSIISDFSTSTGYDDIISYHRGGVIGCGLQVTLETFEDCEVISYDASSIMVQLVKGYDNNLRVVMMPISVGELTILIQEKIEKGKMHRINLIVEEPKIDISCNEGLNFGVIPDGCIATKSFKLHNRNEALVSLHYTIRQEVDGVYDLKEDPDQPGTQMFLSPGETLERTVIMKFPSITDGERKRIQGILQLSINLSEKYMPKKVVGSIHLVVEGFRTRLQALHRSLPQTFHPGQSSNLQLMNGSICPLHLVAKSDGCGFSIRPPNLVIPPATTAVIQISYLPYDPAELSDAVLYIKVVPDGQMFRLTLRGAPHQPNFNPSISVSPSSSSSSLRSESPSIGDPSELGQLELDCTKTHIVWSGVGLGKKQEKTCCLRNRSQHKEKLVFNIIDPTNSYSFVKDGELTQMRMSLVSKQAREITVCFTPRVQGQLRATIQVTRINSDQYKKTIGLLGYGGKGNLQVDGITLDLETEVKRLLLDPQTFCTSICLHNNGDAPSYFYITQPCVESTVVNIKPKGGIVEAGGSKRFVVELRSNCAGTLEEIFRAASSRSGKELRLSSITITHGDRPTALRLLRLYRKHGKDCPDEKLKPIMNSLAEMEHRFLGEGHQTVGMLKDPLNSLCWLYQEGVREWQIDVMLTRSALETALLDSTQQFMALENTIADDTMITQSMLSTTGRDLSSTPAFNQHFRTPTKH